jgi:hypothetical protein
VPLRLDDRRPLRGRLVECLRRLGIEVELAALEGVPYLVEFERRILERLPE